MSTVFAEISMSLDSLIAGPNDAVGNGLGDGGERLHTWLYDLASFRQRHGQAGGRSDRDSELLDDSFQRTGAVVVGRRMFDLAEGWGDNPPFHGPVFVVTHRAHAALDRRGGTTFTFVTGGIEDAIRQAKAAAGERDVSVAGGASIIQQSLLAGLVDELGIHLIPVLLGGGRPLFEELPSQIEMEIAQVIDTPAATHIRYRVRR